MSGEGQLFVHRENADLVAFPALDRLLARQNERGLRKIGFPRDLLHFIIAQASSVGEDCELIAFQRACRENV